LDTRGDLSGLNVECHYGAVRKMCKQIVCVCILQFDWNISGCCCWGAVFGRNRPIRDHVLRTRHRNASCVHRNDHGTGFFHYSNATEWRLHLLQHAWWVSLPGRVGRLTRPFFGPRPPPTGHCQD
jgi:hypothetical protein